MPVYKIRFLNQGPTPFPSDYTLYAATPPVFKDAAISPVNAWSNSLLAKTVASNGIWNIAINGDPLAQCGTSSARPLAVGTAIDITMSEHVTEGDESPGSTFAVYNSNGSPALMNEGYTAPPGAYKIITRNDFSPNLRWVACHGLSDGSAMSRPAATYSLDPNTSYTVFPPSAPKFYLGGFKSDSGTLVDPEPSTPLAEIDFAQHPGERNAVVTLDFSGNYHVEFMTQAVFAMRATSLTSVCQDSNAQLTQLKHQIKIMSDLVNTALGHSEPTTSVGIGGDLWACSLQWTRTVPDPLKIRIASLLRDGMEKRGYDSKYQRLEPYLEMTFARSETIQKRVLYDWMISYYDLPPPMKSLLTDPKVKQIFWMQDVNTSSRVLEVPDVTIPILRPDYECSVEWLEGPNQETKQAITAILVDGMKRQDYYTFEPRIDDKSLVIPVWHVDYPSVETVDAAWKKAGELLDKVFLRNYVTNAKVEGLVYADENGVTTTDQGANGQGIATTLPPPVSTYVCSLTWLEGPNQETKHSIALKLIGAMIEKAYRLRGVDLGGEYLQVTLSHTQIHDPQIVANDWSAARETLGYQIMYTTNPQVAQRLFGTNAEALTNESSEIPPTYICSLSWLEGPNRDTQRDILAELVRFMLRRDYYMTSTRTDDKGASVFFYHSLPYNLPTATADWIAACDSLGFRRMFVTDLKCEFAYHTQTGNVSLSELKIDDNTTTQANDSAVTKNGTNGVNGQETKGATGTETQSQIEAPQVQTFAMSAQESMEERKRRALALLQAEGLLGLPASLGLA